MRQASEDPENSRANRSQEGGRRSRSLTGDVHRYIETRLASLARSMLETSSILWRQPLAMTVPYGQFSSQPSSDRRDSTSSDNSTFLMRKQASSDEPETLSPVSEGEGGEKSSLGQRAGVESTSFAENQTSDEDYYRRMSDRDRWHDAFYDDFFYDPFAHHSFFGDWPIHPTHPFSSFGNSFFGPSFFGGPHHFSFLSNPAAYNTSTWPLSYLFFSPYSPVHLEQQERALASRGTRNGGLFSWFPYTIESQDDAGEQEHRKWPNWRLAFEDLLRVENGLDLRDVSRDSIEDGKDDGKKETGAQWVSGMVNRGSLGSNWKSTHRNIGDGNDIISLSFGEDVADRKDQDQDQDQDQEFLPPPRERKGPLSRLFEGLSELDLYDFFNRNFIEENPFRKIENRWDQLFEKVNDRTVANFPNLKDEQDQTQSEDPTKPRVVATSTSTHRTTVADGSTTTKTVKTRRFADRREETSETSETSDPKS